MRILGIDQGIASLGYCILEIINDKKEILEYGQLITYPDEYSDNMCSRINEIVNLLTDIIKEFNPDRICCEKLFYSAPRSGGGRNKSASIVNTNIASGLIMYLCGKYEIEFRDYSPLSVKNRITGDGKADKDLVRTNVLAMYDELIGEEKYMTEHMIDAVAIATTSYIIHPELEEIM